MNIHKMTIIELLISDGTDLLKTRIYVVVFDKVNKFLLNKANDIYGFQIAFLGL